MTDKPRLEPYRSTMPNEVKDLWARDAEALLVEYKLGYDRYEKLRKLNPQEFMELYFKDSAGYKIFNHLVDQLEA